MTAQRLGLTEQLEQRLATAALDARQRAYAPYSRFKVGAALLTDDGEIIGGCNVENASFGLTLCAERNALTTAVARGLSGFRALAIAADTSPPTRPCGSCLQVMVEFCTDLELVLVNPAGEREREQLSRLLPQAFRHTE